MATRQNVNCCDGFEHQMSNGNWMCGKYHGACGGETSNMYRRNTNRHTSSMYRQNYRINRDELECRTTDDCINGKNCVLGECV